VARWWTAIAVLVLVFASVPMDASAKTKPVRTTIDPALLQDALANPSKTFTVIVQAVPGARTGRATRAGAAVQRSGGVPKHALPIVGSAHAHARHRRDRRAVGLVDGPERQGRRDRRRRQWRRAAP
jgi:hypothetical protein